MMVADNEIDRPSIRAVAFDMDGLMFNTEDLYVEAGTALLRRRGEEPSRKLFDQMMGRPSPWGLQLMIETFGWSESVDELQGEMTREFDRLLPERLRPMPGLLELLTRLETAHIRKAIGTGSTRRFVRRVLELSGLASRFEFIVTSEDVERGKPNPDTFVAIRERFGVSAPELLVLEDSQNGCRAGLGAGATVVAVPCEHSRHHDFDGVHLRVDSLADARLLALIFDR